MDLSLSTVDPYKLLGVNPTAEQDEIRKAYIVLARKLHPDKNKSANAEDRFKELSAAYELIKDADVRRSYDHLRAAEKEKSTENAKRHTSSSFDSFSRSTGQRYGQTTPGPSSHSFFSTRRPNGTTSTGFRMSFNPASAGTTFSFASFMDEDLNESLSAFFRNSSSGGVDSSRTSFSQPYARKKHPTSDFIPDSSRSSSGGETPNPFSSSSWFDRFLSDQLSDVSRLLNQLYEGVPFSGSERERTAMGRAQSESRMKEDGFRGSAQESLFEANGKVRQRKKEKSPFDDMYDWSVPMFDHTARNKHRTANGIDGDGDGVANNDEDMTRIRFPCIYCGRKLICQDLNKHEEVCKRFYSDAETPTRAATSGSGAATRASTNGSGAATRASASGKGSTTRATTGGIASAGATVLPNSNNSNLSGRAGGYDSARAGGGGRSAGWREERYGGVTDEQKWNMDDTSKWKTEEPSSSRRKKYSSEKIDNISCPWCRRVFNQVSFDSHLMICNIRRNHLNDPTRYASSRLSSAYSGRQPQSRTVPPPAAATGASSVIGSSYPYRRGSTSDTNNLSATRPPTSQQRVGRSTTHAGIDRSTPSSIPRSAYSSTERLRRFNYNF